MRSRLPLETSSFKVTGIALNTRATADNRKRGAKRVEIDFNIVPLYNNIVFATNHVLGVAETV